MKSIKKYEKKEWKKKFLNGLLIFAILFFGIFYFVSPIGDYNVRVIVWVVPPVLAVVVSGYILLRYKQKTVVQIVSLLLIWLAASCVAFFYVADAGGWCCLSPAYMDDLCGLAGKVSLFLKEHHMDHYACYGTALGIARESAPYHMIPWEHDIDFCVARRFEPLFFDKLLPHFDEWKKAHDVFHDVHLSYEHVIDNGAPKRQVRFYWYPFSLRDAIGRLYVDVFFEDFAENDTMIYPTVARPACNGREFRTPHDIQAYNTHMFGVHWNVRVRKGGFTGFACNLFLGDC